MDSIKDNRLIFLFFVLIFSACKNNEDHQKIYTKICSEEYNFEQDTITPREPGDAYEGQFYTTTAPEKQYTKPFYIPLGDKYKFKSLKICLDFYARYRGTNFGNSIAVSLQIGDSVLAYKSFPVCNYTWFPEKWYHIVDSTQLDVMDYNGDLRFRLLGFNHYDGGSADYDNIKVSIFEKRQ